VRRTESLGYQINHLGRVFAHALRACTARHGVLPGQFAQLLALYERDGVTQGRLCEQVSIDQSTMAHTLKRMERDGLISRAPDASDARRALIRLTDRARGLETDLVHCANAVNARATRGFTDDELALCHQLIQRMIDNLSDGTPATSATSSPV
jgi:DNA-binding MarR family transcriptional regulator